MPIGVAGVRFCESAPTGFDRPLEISPLEAISGPPFSGRNPGTEYGPTLLVDLVLFCGPSRSSGPRKEAARGSPPNCISTGSRDMALKLASRGPRFLG